MAEDDAALDLVEADLDEWLAGEAPVAAPEAGEPEPVRGEEEAARLVRVVRYLEREKSKVKRVVDRQVADVRAWGTDRTAGLTNRQRYLERLLEQWMRATGTSTRSFPAGTLRLRPGRQRVEVVDEDLFVTWAAERDRLDLLKLTASKEGIGRHLAEPPAADPERAMTDVTRGAIYQGEACDWADDGEEARLLTDAVTGGPIPGVCLVRARDKKFTCSPNP